MNTFIKPRIRTPQQIQSLINRYAKYSQNPLSLNDLLAIKTSGTASSYRFLRGEIPTRLSHAIVELESIPGELLNQPSIREVDQKYRQSFLDLLDLPTASEYGKLSTKNRTLAIHEFSERLERILERHSQVVPTMGIGILELKQHHSSDRELYYLKEFLDRFYLSRIGLRTNMDQYLNSFTYPRADDNWIGIFSKKCNIRELCEGAIEYTDELSKQLYSTIPSITIETFDENNNPCSLQPIIKYCPSHIHYILTELLKNSIRAVVEKYGESSAYYPPINIHIHSQQDETLIKIIDKGGGIPLEHQSLLFSYSYSTANKPSVEQLHSDSGLFAGFGYGLALSRLHARYFGGEILLCPIPKIGTEAYIYLSHSENSTEDIPELDKPRLQRYMKNLSQI